MLLWWKKTEKDIWKKLAAFTVFKLTIFQRIHLSFSWTSSANMSIHINTECRTAALYISYLVTRAFYGLPYYVTNAPIKLSIIYLVQNRSILVTRNMSVFLFSFSNFNRLSSFEDFKKIFTSYLKNFGLKIFPWPFRIHIPVNIVVVLGQWAKTEEKLHGPPKIQKRCSI